MYVSKYMVLKDNNYCNHYCRQHGTMKEVLRLECPMMRPVPNCLGTKCPVSGTPCSICPGRCLGPKRLCATCSGRKFQIGFVRHWGLNSSNRVDFELNFEKSKQGVIRNNSETLKSPNTG